MVYRHIPALFEHWVNDELERMCKEAVVAKFEVLSRHLPGGTKGNHENPQSG